MGEGQVVLQVACRGSWPSPRDASVCRLHQRCSSVLMMRKRLLVSRSSLGCEIPYL